MKSDRYFALLDGLEALADAPPMTERAQSPTEEVLPARVLREWKRVRRRVRFAGETDDRDERDRRLHEARKAAKRARYAAEPLVGLYGTDAQAFVAAFKRIQSVLGDHNDSIVTQAKLRQLSDRAARDCDNAFAFGVLYVREEATAARGEAKFTKAWRSASDAKLRAWLA
jgi:CHAD domain-containing protein